MALDKAKPEIGPPNKRAGWLLAGLTLLAGVLTAVGVATDDLTSVWRNHQLLSFASLTLILVAMALGAAAGWILTANTPAERTCLLVGNGLLGLGLIFAAWAGLALASDRPEPTITAKPVQSGGKTMLDIVVENSKLRDDEDLSVTVEPLFETRRGEGAHFKVGKPLYSASLGPNAKGDVERTIRVDIPPGEFRDIGARAWVGSPSPCYDERATTGCVVVRLPPRTQEPQLTFRWKRASRAGASLRVHVTALDIPNGSLQLRAQSVTPRRRLLAQAMLAPNLHGDVDHVFNLPVKGTRIVCVAAGTGERRLQCPPQDRGSPSWARLRVPRQK